MDASTVVALAMLFALGAALYSSVGHGGASAYIAAMALFSVAPETMKPTALALNLLVAGFGAWRYWRRGLTNWKLLLRVRGNSDSSGLHRRRNPPAGDLLQAAGRDPAVARRDPAAVEADGDCRTARPRASAVDQPSRRRCAWPPCRTDRTGRRNIPQPTDHPLALGGSAAHFGRRRCLHLPQLRRRARRKRRIGRTSAARASDLSRSVFAGALLGTWLGVERLPRPWLLRTLGVVLTVAGAKLLFT